MFKKISKKKILIVAAVIVCGAGFGYGAGSVSGAFASHYHARTHRIAKCHAYKYLSHAKTASRLYKSFRKMHLTKKQSAVMVGLAYKSSHMRPTVKQAGDGSGYGLYQVTDKRAMMHWCKRHHVSYKSVNGQARYMYHEFIKPARFNKAHGSLRHLSRVAEFKVERSAVPQTNLIYKFAKRAYTAFE